ncbi:MAG: S8 family serine peptidase [Burkholderiales bacterium]|nr:S8 family serine peptidase [Burkholderiales bacterium]
MTVLPKQEPLTESAMAFRERRMPTIPLRAAKIPSGMQIDETAPALPMGGAHAAAMSMESLQANVSEHFVVQGFVEAEKPEDVPETSDGKVLYADPQIAPFQYAQPIAGFATTCGNTPPVGDDNFVRSRLNVGALAGKNLDGMGVAIAIMDTGINLAHLNARLGAGVRLDAQNSWSPQGGLVSPGKYPVNHGTMCAYDALIAAPKATLFDYPILGVQAPGGGQMSGSIGVALIAFSHLMANWAVAFAPGGASKYKALIVNNSWGMFHPSWDLPVGHPGRYCDNPNHPFNLVVGVLARSADILFAAGNCGDVCADSRCNNRTTGTIMGANAHADVLTVAGCDVNNRRVGYSSQGPSIQGMPQQKPDLATYTHFKGSEAFGAGTPDSGTSAACPVAAGCVAALRTRLDPRTTPSANLFAQLRASAQSAGGTPGWNGDYGYGILDPLAAAGALGL